LSHRASWLGLIGIAALIAGCSAGSTPPLPAVPAPSTTPAPSPSSVSKLPGCDDRDVTGSRVASYAPDGALPAPGDFPATSRMAEIRKRGKLRVGVSADNLLFGFRNPIKKTLEGFDIDMVKAVAAAIFGPEHADSHIQYVVENFAQRIPDLQSPNPKVDMVADIMTINCTRWNQIAFSAEYFHAGQQVLVRRDSKYNSLADLNQKKATVCSGKGSTGSETLQKPEYKQIKPRLVDDISDCMVLFQQGAVNAVISDNTVVQGFATQDPYAVLLKGFLSQEPYGLGFNKGDVDFVRFVNALLQKMRADGDWQRIHDRWLPNDDTKQPPAVYGRALP
jgi:polar amino acid transport system substrate-binding protein